MKLPEPMGHASRHRFAWPVVSLLFAASVVNYMDRAALGVVMPQVRKDLSLSNTDYGLALNSFLLAYMIFYILGGRLADRLGYLLTFALTVVFWSIASMLHSLAGGLASLCVFRALLGVGEGGYYPTAIRAISDWFAPDDRAKPIGILLCGTSIGTLVTPPIVAWITLYQGWRAAFLFTGFVGLLLLPAWWILHVRIRRSNADVWRKPLQGTDDTLVDSKDEIGITEVLRSRKYLLLLLTRAITDPVWYFYVFWIPSYFQDVRAFDLQMVGRYLWIPYFWADAGAIFGAVASSYLIKRGFGLDLSRKSVIVASAFLNMAAVAAYFVSSPWVALGLISISTFGHMSCASNIHTVITEISPKRHIAVLYGLIGAAGVATGAVIQPITGWLVDSRGYLPALTGCGVAYLLGTLSLLAAGTIQPIKTRSS